MNRRVLLVVCACLMGMGVSKCWKGDTYQDSQVLSDSSDGATAAAGTTLAGTAPTSTTAAAATSTNNPAAAAPAAVEYSTVLNSLTNMLNSYVIGLKNSDNRVVDFLVDYKGLAADTAARKELTNYLNWAGTTKDHPSAWKDEDDTAFLMNVYNGTVLAGILADIDKNHGTVNPNAPVAAIQALAVKIGFLADVTTLDGLAKKLFAADSLKDDPRRYFVLCDGTMGSPPLRNEAYESPLDHQLDEQEAIVMVSPRLKVVTGNGAKKLQLPKFLLDHRAEFEKTQEGSDPADRKLIAYLKDLVPDAMSNDIQAGSVGFEPTPPDLRLNNKQ